MLLWELIAERHPPGRAAFNAIRVMIVIMLFQRPIIAMGRREPIGPAVKQSIIDIFAALAGGARNMAPVALATAAAGIIVGAAVLGLGPLVVAVIGTLSDGNIFLVLIITAITSLSIGMGLPTMAAYIVTASLTAPALVTIGASNGVIVPLVAAHLFCFYFGILADDVPLMGRAAYVSAAIAKSLPLPTGRQGATYCLRTAILPFMFVFNSDLILYNVASWPQGILIFSMACLGSFAFASATQGWFVVRNKIWGAAAFLCGDPVAHAARSDRLAHRHSTGEALLDIRHRARDLRFDVSDAAAAPFERG